MSVNGENDSSSEQKLQQEQETMINSLLEDSEEKKSLENVDSENALLGSDIEEYMKNGNYSKSPDNAKFGNNEVTIEEYVVNQPQSSNVAETENNNPENISEKTIFIPNDESDQPLNSEDKNPQYLIPPSLAPFIYHSSDSLTYIILTGRKLTGLPLAIVNSILNDLRKYLDITVDNNMISEACYIQTLIDDLKQDQSGVQISADKDIEQIDRKIQETNDEINERLAFWRHQEQNLEKELDMAMADLRIQLDQAISQLDNEWRSEKKQQQYSKPSPALLNMREMAKKMIKSRRFDEVKRMGIEIAEREKQEVFEATERMNSDYRIADQRIHEKFELEKSVITRIHESKLNNLIRRRDSSLRPIYQRLENLQKSKEVVKKSQKIVVKTHRQTPRESQKIQNQTLPAIIGTPKLSLPSVTPLKRDTGKKPIIRAKTQLKN